MNNYLFLLFLDVSEHKSMHFYTATIPSTRSNEMCYQWKEIDTVLYSNNNKYDGTNKGKVNSGKHMTLHWNIRVSFKQDIPFELFQLLPDGNKWLRIDNRTVEGLNTPFGIACLPTGSVLDSVMLLILPLFGNSVVLIFYLKNNNFHHLFIVFMIVEPKRLILYTGSFNKCHEVLISDLYLNFKGKITDLYVDNTLASSKHVEIESTQEFRACKRIETIVE